MLRRLLQRSANQKTANPSSPPAAIAADPAERARSATSNKARAAAVAEIDNVTTLQQLAETSELMACCADRLAELGEQPIALELATTRAARIELAITCHQSALKEALIRELRDEEALLELERNSRNRNKPANRAARTALDALRHARSTAADAAELSAGLSQQVNRLEHDAHLQARYAMLKTKWQAAQSQWQQATQRLATYQETAKPFTALPDCPIPQSSGTASNAEVDFAEIAQRFEAVRVQLVGGASAAQLRDTIAESSKHWHEAIKQATPQPATIDEVKTCTDLFESAIGAQQRWATLQERADQLLRQTSDSDPASHTGESAAQIQTTQTAGPTEEGSTVGSAESTTPDTDATIDFATAPLAQLKKLWPTAAEAGKRADAIKTLLADLRWPDALPPPALLQELSARRTDLQQIVNTARTRKQNVESDLGKRLNRAARSLNSGHAQDAQRTHQQAQRLIDALPEDAAGRLRTQHSTLHDKLQQVRDWQQFATDPKRDELVAAMEALAENPVNPLDQANEVKALRAQWRELGSLGQQQLTQRFESAAEKAFEPARQHFADQAQARADNLHRRTAIVTQLTDYLASTDWANADMSAAQSILNSAREAWRAAFPVERGPNRAVEKQFNAATDELYKKLRSFWDQNLEQKSQLVGAAKALLTDSRPLGDRLNSAKDLQAQWKRSGSAPRGQEQRLWKEFRTACDALFAQRDQERDAAAAQRSAITNAINERITAFEIALNATDTATDIPRNHFSNFDRELSELGPIDQNQRRKLNELKARCDGLVTNQANRAAQLELDELHRLDRQCADCELANSPIADALIEAQPLFGKRQPPPDNAAHDLVLEAEWLAQIDPPEADRQRRMELQVSWMNQGMNAGARLEADPMTLARRWCQFCATPVAADLRERLFAACAALMSKPS